MIKNFAKYATGFFYLIGGPLIHAYMMTQHRELYAAVDDTAWSVYQMLWMQEGQRAPHKSLRPVFRDRGMEGKCHDKPRTINASQQENASHTAHQFHMATSFHMDS